MSTESELFDRLTNGSRVAYGAVARGEVDAVRRYQAPDRFYVVVNRVLRGDRSIAGEEARVAAKVINGLDAVVKRWVTPEPLRVFRGVRNAAQVFGTVPPRPGTQLVPRGFVSTSIYRDVAVSEFTVPAAAGRGALLEIDVPVGTPAIWVPPLGVPELARQGELVLNRGIRLSLGDCRAEGGIVVVTCEVVP